MKYKCPNCNEKVIIGKEKLVNCSRCNKNLLLAKINGVETIFDVTPDKEELKK